MTQVINKGDSVFRYLVYASKEYIAWSPGQVRDVDHGVAKIVTDGHPGRMEFALVEPPSEATAPDHEGGADEDTDEEETVSVAETAGEETTPSRRRGRK